LTVTIAAEFFSVLFQMVNRPTQNVENETIHKFQTYDKKNRGRCHGFWLL